MLCLVLLAQVQGFDTVYMLADNLTYEQCLDERNRVGWEMAEAYPHEADFRIVCQCRNCEDA